MKPMGVVSVKEAAAIDSAAHPGMKDAEPRQNDPMRIRLNSLSVLLCGLTLAVGMTTAGPADAQLGSINNPPPQNLFNADGSPKPRDNGLGTMAERRRALAHSKARRPVHRRPAH